ncbi:biotin/lipoyl-binding protein [Sphingomonas abietis]|uniref:HlyD family secretion protein n=1 Tax=Sphingomonas abietis TaxID=3012344 RepID=A0ABY7NSZ8_9SPHN|nr:HlyD family secretion protein [Sphingomonas abietis]WBO24257.1 HlyD family secretion protein [Sphingomonas abietis]
MTRLLPTAGRVLLTLLFVALAIVALVIVWRHYEDDPWTRDGALQADIVQVSADVAGLVTQIRVHDNQFVHAGDILFTVDQERYAAQLAQSDAAVVSARAAIENARAAIANAQATLDNALREEKRYLALGDLVSQEMRDARVTAVEQDRAALVQAHAGVASANASLKQAEANRRLAAVNMTRSAVRAGVNGYITGFSMRPGDYVAAGSPQFALLDTDSYYVLGYMEETKLHRFQIGDRARINLLGDRRPLWGHVDSLAAGITDRQQNSSGVLLPNITPTFSWIRLAQRVPVRVVIDRVPVGIRLVAGRTATVTILPTLHKVAPRPIPASTIVPNTAPLDRPASVPIGRPNAAVAP